MSQTTLCRQCGTRLSPGTVEGLCPKCLARMTFSWQSGREQRSSPRGDRAGAPGLGIFGDYELLEEIGRGGMGAVYKARQLSLNRTVAVKVILSGRFASESAIERFRGEAEAAGNLQHSHIVAIHEVGEEKGHHFFSMDYVEGPSLADLVREKPLPPKRAARYVQKVALAIHYAHERGTVHRDLKPSNILIDPFDEPRVADFGLAKRLTGDLDLTLTGQVIGSPNFLAPEQARGQGLRASASCDIYALGAVLYYLVTGRPPFLSESLEETLHLVLTSDPPAPTILNPAIPKDLETICLKCLEKEPARRYGSAGEVAGELTRFLDDQPIQARPLGPAGKLWRWARRNPTLSAVSLTLLVCLLAISIGSPIALFRIRDESRRTREAQKELRAKLWDSYLAQARALRWSRKAGSQFEGLEIIAKAVEIQPSLALRNEAIASLALHDIRLVKTWDQFEEQREFACLNLNSGCYAYGGPSGEISLRKISDETELVRLPALGSKVRYMAEFSPDGRYLIAIYRDGLTRLWDWRARRVAVEFKTGVYGDFNDFSPDGSRVAVCSNLREVDLYGLPEGARLKSFPLEGQPHCVRFNPRKAWLAVACRDRGRIKILAEETGEIISEFGAGAPIFELAWHPDGEHLVAACEDRRLYLWNASRQQNLKQWPGHEMSQPVRVTFHPSGRLFASGGWDGKIRLWSFPDAEELVHLGGEGQQLDFDRTGRWLTCYGWNGNLPRIYEIAAHPVVHTLQKHASATDQTEGTVAFSRGGQYLAFPSGDVVKVWHAASGRTVMVPTGPATSVFFSPDHQQLYVSGARGLSAWTIRTDATEGLVADGPPAILNTNQLGRAVSGGHSLVAMIANDRCQVFDLAGNRVTAVTGEHPRLRFVAMDPAGEWVATGGWNVYGVRVWSAKTGELRKELKTALSPNVAFTPDGKFLITSTSDDYRFYDLGTWEVRRTIKRGNDNNINGTLAFCEANGLVALAYTRNLIRLLRQPGFEVVADLESPNPESVFDLAFDPGGTHLAAMRGADTMEIWDLALVRERLRAIGLDEGFPSLEAR